MDGEFDYFKSGVDSVFGQMDNEQLNISKTIMDESNIGIFKQESELKKNKSFISKSRRVLSSFDFDTDNMSDEEISQAMVEEISGYNMNLTDTAFIAYKMQDKDKTIAKDFQDLVTAYDATDTDMTQVFRGLGEILTDPTSYIPFGAGLAGKKLAQMGMKEALIRGAGIGAIEGATYMAADSALKQSTEMVATDGDFNFDRLGTESMIGAAFGGTVGGAVTGISKKIMSRHTPEIKDIAETKPTEVPIDSIDDKTFEGSESVKISKSRNQVEIKFDGKYTTLKGNINKLVEKDILDNINDSEAKSLAKGILEKNKGINFYSADKVYTGAEEADGLYVSSGKNVFFNKDKMTNEDLILHELLHTKFVAPLELLSGNRKSALNVELEDIRSKLVDALNKNKSNKNTEILLSDKPGDFHEFLSEAMSSKEYISQLRSIDDSSGKFKSLYHKILGFVMNLFGKKYDKGNLYGRLDDVTSRLMKDFENQKKTMPKEDLAKLESKGIFLSKAELKTMRDIKVDSGKALKEQKYVNIELRKRLDTHFSDERGRDYVEAYLNSAQGKASSKAANEKYLGTAKKDIKSYLKEMEKAFNTDVQLKSVYGRSETKLAKPSGITKAEEYRLKSLYMTKLLNDLRSHKLNITDNRIVNNLLKEYKSRAMKVPEELGKDTDEIYVSQDLSFKKPKMYESEMKSQWDIRKTKGKGEYVGFGWKTKHMSYADRKSKLINTVADKLDKKNFLDAVEDIERKATLKGIEFDINNISDEVKDVFRANINDITDYIERKHDILKLEDGSISAKEFAFRESLRIEAKHARDGVIGGKFEQGELGAKLKEQIAEFEDIDMYRPKGAERVKKTAGQKTEKPDDTNYDILNKVRAKKINAINAYRKDGTILRNTSKDSGRLGAPVLTVSQQRDARNFPELTAEEIVDKTTPLVSDSKKAEAIKISRQKAKDKIRAKKKGKLGLNFSFIPKEISFNQSIIDVKNSMGQLIATLTGSQDLADTVMLSSRRKPGEAKPMEIRGLLGVELGKRLSKLRGEDIKLGKTEIKTPFMIKGYGSGDKGIAQQIMKENSFIKNEKEAMIFVDEFNKVFADISPAMSDLMNHIRDIHSKRTDPVYKYTMPDGFKVEFDLSDYADYVIKDGKNLGIAKVKQNTIDKMSRALLPNIIHSFDGYVAREMRRKFKEHNGVDIHTTHDAFHIPKGQEALAEEFYRDIMCDMNSKDMMADIFKQIEPTSTWRKPYSGLSDETFGYDRELMDSEHMAKSTERAEKPQLTSADKPITTGKQMTDSEVMREFMATDSHRTHNYTSMIDAMIDESTQVKGMAVAKTNDDVFERALAYALQGDIKSFEKNIVMPPKGSIVNTDMWKSESMRIFKEFRAGVEYNPLLRKAINGQKREYFNSSSEVIKGTIKEKRRAREEALSSLKQKAKVLEQRGSDIDVNSIEELSNETDKAIAKIKSGKLDEVTGQDIDIIATHKVLGVEQKYASHTLPSTDSGSLPSTSTSTDGKSSALDRESKPSVDTTVRNTFASKTVKATVDVDMKRVEEVKKKTVKELFNETIFHLTEKYKDTKSYKQYQKLVGLSKNPEKAAETAGDNLTKYIDELIPEKEQAEWMNTIFETDARAIREFKTKAEAMEFVNKNIDLINLAKPEIEQLAKAIGREEHQIGAFLNNARAIALELNIPLGRIPDIDKLVSIEAMNQNNAWDFYEKNHGSSKFNLLLDIAQTQFDRSTFLFGHEGSLSKQVKGYIAEVYDGGKIIKDDGTIQWDAEVGIEQGVLSGDILKAKVGKDIEFDDESVSFGTRAENIKFANDNSLKITPNGYRRVADGSIRDKAGRINSLSQRLGTNEASIERKIAQHNKVTKILTDTDAFSEMFSKKPKEGFTELTKDQRAKLPFQMKGEVNFVNSKYVEKLLGRPNVRWTKDDSKQIYKIVDVLLENLVTQFKKSVVLLNPASYKSAILVNFTTNMMLDINPIESTRYAKGSLKAYQEFARLSKEYNLNKATGATEKYSTYDHNTGKNIVKTRVLGSRALAETELQKYIDAGLSINTLDGIRSNSTLMHYMFSDLTGNRLDKIANSVMFNQRAASGNMVKQTFSFIDFQGRYIAIKHLEKKGLSTEDAIRRANDLFGQMDDMAPVFIQAIDKYGVFIFSKWLASVAPATLKAAKQNPANAVAVTGGLIGLSLATDTMLNNVSPLESVVDMTEGGATGDSIVWKTRNATSLVPGVYRDIYKQARYFSDEDLQQYDRPSIFWKDRMEPFYQRGKLRDYRGVTQKAVDYVVGE